MFRLNQRAYEILKAEILRQTTDDLASKVQQEIALKRLEKLRLQKGVALSHEELQDTILDLFPAFSEKVLKQATWANRPPSKLWSRLQFATIAIVGVTGGIWVLNLPYPMIRYPVSRIAPIILLPSFMSMDYHYRQAIALVEQADQLVNRATSAADFELGAAKVKSGQSHLDALPVWFLGYYPQMYCSWFQCGWRFTLDEFQQARQSIARMDAKLFQEKNAQTQLDQADRTLGTVKQQFQEASNPGEKSAAIAQWQQSMDTLEQIPRETLAGRLAQTKLMAYKRDFKQVVGFTDGNARSSNLIQAAKEFATLAEQSSKGPFHSTVEWEEIQKQWQDAIERLEKIDVKDPDFGEAQKLLARYKNNLKEARIRLSAEQQSEKSLNTAQELTQRLVGRASSMNQDQISSQLQAIETQLSKVQAGTSSYAKAQELIKFTQTKLKQYQK